MPRLLRIKVDVTKLDKTAFFKGAKGTYADLSVWINDEPDQWDNDASVQQDLGKERRQAGEKGPYVGNGKWVTRDGGQRSAVPVQQTRTAPAPVPAADEGEDIPF